MTAAIPPFPAVKGKPGRERSTTNPLRIVVRDDPAPQGSKRHVGNGRMIEQSKKVAPWREAVKTAAHREWARCRRCNCPVGDHSWVDPGWCTVCSDCRYDGGHTLGGPVEVTIVFTLHKPLSAPKKRRTWPSKRPDLDKLVRSTFDALGAAGVWRDDAQVVELHAHKRYPNDGPDALESPGAVIYVTEVSS